MKIVIPDPTNDQEKFIVDGKKDEVVGVIMTYISWEIQFHLSGIEFPHQVWKKLKCCLIESMRAMSCSWRKS
jgi:hypothetical protein